MDATSQLHIPRVDLHDAPPIVCRSGVLVCFFLTGRCMKRLAGRIVRSCFGSVGASLRLRESGLSFAFSEILSGYFC